MRLFNKALIALVLFSVVIFLPGCAAKSTATSQGQVATVRRGNISTNITGVGNLALSHTEDLAFNIPASFNIVSNPITVEEVLVKAGDSVQEGQLLATLDKSGWDAQIANLEDAITTAQRNVTAKQRAVTQSQLTLLKQQSAVNSAQLSLENTAETSTDPLQILISQLNLQAAQETLALNQSQVDDANTAVSDAQKAVKDAQQNLTDARAASPEIKAPFTGFITNVNVAGGDEVKKGTIAMTIADPNKFEANIMVNEVNMAQVKLGGNATVSVDSMPGVILPAKLTQISPTATIQSSVVNYQVQVEIQSLQPLATTSLRSNSGVSSANVSSQFGSRSRLGAGSGNFTQSQRPATINQRQQSGNQPATGQQQTPSTGGRPQTSTTAPASVQLRQGLTVTVTIVVQEVSNVLLVPNQAITLQQGQAYVKVPAADGTNEQRAITTGINNAQYTEVTGGLNEGDKVVVPQATAPASTNQQFQQGGGIRIPGVGGLGR